MNHCETKIDAHRTDIDEEKKSHFTKKKALELSASQTSHEFQKL